MAEEKEPPNLSGVVSVRVGPERHRELFDLAQALGCGVGDLLKDMISHALPAFTARVAERPARLPKSPAWQQLAAAAESVPGVSGVIHEAVRAALTQPPNSNERILALVNCLSAVDALADDDKLLARFVTLLLAVAAEADVLDTVQRHLDARTRSYRSAG